MDNTPDHALGNGGRVRCSCCTVWSAVRYNLEVNPLGLSNYTAKSEVEENARERERTHRPRQVKAATPSSRSLLALSMESSDSRTPTPHVRMMPCGDLGGPM